jgi:ribosomal protein S27AE
VLYSEGELNNGDLARAAGISTRTLEKHKKLLIDERLAFEVKRDGQKFYALDEGRAIFFLYRLLKLDEWTRYLKDRPVLWPRVISEVTSMDGYLLLTRKQCEECGLGSIMTDERRLEATMNLPGGSLKVNNAVNDSDTFWISWLDLLSSLQQLKFNELCEKIFIRIKEGSVCPNCSKPKDDLFLLSHVSTNELNDFVCGKCGHVWQRREEAPKGDKDRDFESKYPMSSFKARRRPPKDYSSYNKLGVKNPLKRSYLRNTNKPIAEGSTSEAS